MNVMVGLPERVLVLAATTAYQLDDLVAAAHALGVELLVGTDRCHVLAEVWREGAIALDFRDPDRAAAQIVAHAAAAPIRGIVPTDERTAVIAATAARRLGLAHNPVRAAQATANKLRLRTVLTGAGMRQPAFCAITAAPDPLPAAEAPAPPPATGAAPDENPARAASAPPPRLPFPFPVVVKPLHLSASRGVMRADDPAELAERLGRLRRLLADPAVQARDPAAAGTALVEAFVAGPELAFEGLLSAGRLATLAIFDKPDPLDGPFFAETIYVTPSELPRAEQQAVVAEVAAAARAIGLREGPVHAELRVAAGEPVVIEIAARAIGGLCGRTLRFGAGISLEEVLLAHAAGRDLGDLRRGGAASGVMMLPVPEAGVLRGIDGEAQARAVPGVRDVVLTARPGDRLTPLPEGDAYLGFVFASGRRPGEVTRALRRAAGALTCRIARRL